jgi:hypothetical protein
MKRYEYYRPMEFIWNEEKKEYRGFDLARFSTNVKDRRKVTLDQAKQLIEESKKSRQTQYEYHTNKTTGERTRTSFYDTHKLNYTIQKVVEEIEEVYEENNEIKEKVDYNDTNIEHFISI